MNSTDSQPHARWIPFTVNLTQAELNSQSTSCKMNSTYSPSHWRWTPFTVNLMQDELHLQSTPQPRSRWTPTTVNLIQDALHLQSTSLKMNPIHSEPQARWTPLTVNLTTSLKMNSHHSQPHSRWTPLAINLTEEDLHLQSISLMMNSIYNPPRSSIYSYSHWRYSPAPWPKNKADVRKREYTDKMRSLTSCLPGKVGWLDRK